MSLIKSYYKQRQAIVEHPYGTIKRQWGFSYIMTKKTKQRAEADVGLIFTAYNLRRLMTIIVSYQQYSCITWQEMKKVNYISR